VIAALGAVLGAMIGHKLQQRSPARSSHCAQAQSRTPSVAALYGARLRSMSVTDALTDVRAALPEAHPMPEFREALQRLHPTVGGG
jgi:hypothetical protein